MKNDKSYFYELFINIEGFTGKYKNIIRLKIL